MMVKQNNKKIEEKKLHSSLKKINKEIRNVIDMALKEQAKEIFEDLQLELSERDMDIYDLPKLTKKWLK